MTEENRNLILAFSLSMLVLFGWFYFVDRPRMEAEQTQQATTTPAPQAGTPVADISGVPRPDAIPGAVADTAGTAMASRAEMLARTPRIRIDNGQVHGSISLQGGRLDDLTLATYHETVSPESAEIILLSPAGSPEPYYAEYGFVSADGSKIPLPNHQTVWSGDVKQTLSPGNPITLQWDNGAGLKFTRVIAVDDHYLFTVTEKVENSGAAPVSLMPYGLVSRHYTPTVAGYYILHEGLLGVLGGALNEITYEDIRETPSA